MTHKDFKHDNFGSMKTPSKRQGFTAPTDTEVRIPATAGQPSQEDELLGEPSVDAAVDPIKALKKIFKPKDKMKRAPVDVHPVMNKYKQRNFTASENLRSLRTRTHRTDQRAFYDTNPIKYLNQNKQFKEDSSVYDPNIQQLTQHDQTSERLSQMEHISRLTTGNRDQAALDGDGIAAGQFQVDGGLKPLLQSQNTRRDTGIKEKLESLRKLFAEEDMNEQVKNIQKQWKQQDEEYDKAGEGYYNSLPERQFASFQNAVAQPDA